MKLSGKLIGISDRSFREPISSVRKRAFEAPVVIAAAGGDDLRAEHLERLRIELALPVHHGTQHRQAAHVAIVENLDDLGPFVTEAEISFVEDKSAAKRIEGVEDR